MAKYLVPSSKFAMACELKARIEGKIDAGSINMLRNVDANGGIEVFVCGEGYPMGYIAYGMISRESFNRMRDYGLYPEYAYELREGRILLLLEILINPRMKHFFFKKFRPWLREFKLIAYRRHSKVVLLKRNKNRFNCISYHV